MDEKSTKDQWTFHGFCENPNRTQNTEREVQMKTEENTARIYCLIKSFNYPLVSLLHHI